MSHLDPSPGREIVSKWAAAILSAYLMARGLVGLVSGVHLSGSTAWALREVVEPPAATWWSLGFLTTGALLLWAIHRFEDGD
ncbi:MAG: hypothetical protein IT363_12125 [Methanoregulaceae archaeon]|nr:hypothetical protein [Methanoregulaceae archaeon]